MNLKEATLGYHLKYRKSMLRQELLPFLETLDTLYTFLLLNKAAYALFQVHYLECWARFKVVLLRERWRLSEQEYARIEEEAGMSIQGVQDMKKVHGKIFKSVRDEFTFHRYRSDLQTFETLGYPGREWSWSGDINYFGKEKMEVSTFGLPIVVLRNVCWFDPFATVLGVLPGKYHVYLLHGLRSGNNNMLNCSELFVEMSSGVTGNFE